MSSEFPSAPLPLLPAIDPWENRLIAFRYDAESGAVFRLWLKITGLTLITLGVYRFWGITAYRRLLWSRLSFDGDRLSYEGTGGELFRRFLIAAGLLFGLGLVPSALFTFLGWQAMVVVWQIAFYLILLTLVPLGLFSGRRYRLSRTVWRGIRGSMAGGPWPFVWRYVVRLLGLSLSLGLARPWFQVFVWNRLTGHTRFGHWRMRSRMRGGWLFTHHLGAIGLFLLLMIPGLMVFGVLSLATALAIRLNGGPLALFMIQVVTVLVIVPVWGGIAALASSLYRARWFRLAARCTRLGPVQFRSDVSAGAMVGFSLVNLLIMLVTLGTGQIFLQHRTFAFLARHVRVYGRERLAELTQTPGQAKPKAEGLALVLDLVGEGFPG
jgi:uncharacterized membrane protein YjgN (DUF898 family)